jgi:hypothetical protein
MSTIAAGTTTTTALVNTGDTTGKLTFQTNGTTTAMTIDTSQNVGIGTTSPGYQLNTSKAGGVGDAGQLVRFTNTSTGNSLGPFHLTIGTANYFASNPGQVLAGTNGIALAVGDGSDLAAQRKLTIDSSGNVGIGTSSPGARLDVTGSSVVAKINSSNNTNVLGISYNSTIGGYLGANGTNLILSNSSGSEAMRIDSSSNVLVGTSSQLYSSKLTVESGTANATTYTTVATKGGSSMAHQQQSTTGVSTSLVTILTPGTGPYAAFCVVFGSDGTNRFIDLVLFSVGTGTINVVSSLSAAGSPAARTYAQNSSSLQLSMGSGTYTVQVTTIGMGS